MRKGVKVLHNLLCHKFGIFMKICNRKSVCILDIAKSSIYVGYLTHQFKSETSKIIDILVNIYFILQKGTGAILKKF